MSPARRAARIDAAAAAVILQSYLDYIRLKGERERRMDAAGPPGIPHTEDA
jgi:hypothetical protein